MLVCEGMLMVMVQQDRWGKKALPEDPKKH